jgi:hypothetical protein
MPNDEQPAADDGQTRAGDANRAGKTARGTDFVPDATVTLERMEKLLSQIRGALDADARDGEHRGFSIRRLIGAVLQVTVAGLVALALLDWLLQAPVDSLLVKLAFAAVLQLSALTAFVLSGGE